VLETSKKKLIYKYFKCALWSPNSTSSYPDGTKSKKMNSGSSIRYPVNFLPGEERKVFPKRKAFFDVAKDSSPIYRNAEPNEHKGIRYPI